MNELQKQVVNEHFSAAPQDILVVGCGLGHLAWELERKGNHVWACHDSLAFAFQLQRWAQERDSEVEFFSASPLHIQPFSDGFFDATIVDEEVGCYEEVHALFEEVNRVTCAGGLVIGTHLLRNCSPRRQLRNLDIPLIGAFIREKSRGSICRVWACVSGFIFSYHSPGAMIYDE